MKKIMSLDKVVLFKYKASYRGHDNPERYYLAHPELHHLTRRELSIRDWDLYKSLLKWGEISIVPVQRNQRYALARHPKSEIEKIIMASYEESRGVALIATNPFYYSENCVFKYWREAGLKIRKRRSLDQRHIQEIINAYQSYDGNALQASQYTGYSQCTILKYWKQAGLKTRSAGRPRKIPKKIILS